MGENKRKPGWIWRFYLTGEGKSLNTHTATGICENRVIIYNAGNVFLLVVG
jgi:hypothetical protein